VAALAKAEGLPDFDGGALARIVEFGMRQAGDRERVLSVTGAESTTLRGRRRTYAREEARDQQVTARTRRPRP
jgi:hypothetical protein